MPFHLDAKPADVRRGILRLGEGPGEVAGGVQADEVAAVVQHGVRLTDELFGQRTDDDPPVGGNRDRVGSLGAVMARGAAAPSRSLDRARELLIDGQFAVARVSKEVGYGSVSHFISEFRARLVVTPRTYSDAHSPSRELRTQPDDQAAVPTS